MISHSRPSSMSPNMTPRYSGWVGPLSFAGARAPAVVRAERSFLRTLDFGMVSSPDRGPVGGPDSGGVAERIAGAIGRRDLWWGSEQRPVSLRGGPLLRHHVNAIIDQTGSPGPAHGATTHRTIAAALRRRRSSRATAWGDRCRCHYSGR